MSAQLFTPIQRNDRQRGATLAMLVYDEIKNAIVSGRIKPGEWLPVQRNMEALLQVSRPPIREALTKLQGEGLLTAEMGRGLKVADVFEEAIASPLSQLMVSNPQVRLDILEFRRLLEGAAAFYAAQRSTSKEHKRLRELYQRLKWAYTEGTLLDAAKADARYHLGIIEAAHNQAILSVMSGFYTILQDSVLDAADTIRRDKQNWDETDRHHRQLLETIISGDAEQAQRLACEHLTFLYSRLSIAQPVLP
ncbi:Pyruvate dehydrogenase complex repressor [Enterobacter sp. DC4]|uniref:FadR/GntR family transcriptional regulator n=1 Tax=Enterobacter sp. DC4 TaxID=1395580 RepID=UPI0003ECE4EE|nr:FCD domain-containing protein [Enterobacter sp. DC4]EWG65591.1 Pyruvate dehydrogenase complex repressor [Enterobacter sp. DC4]